MIQGQRKLSLTPQAILNKISDFDIFRFYMPDHNWRINQVTISPFPRPGRGIEKNPSFLIGTRGGDIHFIDYADSSKRGDAFTFVKLLHNMVSMDDVLKKIDQDFSLGISCKPVSDYKKIVSEYKQPEELGKRYCLIQAITRKFTKEELSYWNQYHQSIDDLRTNNIYSIKELYVNRSKFFLKDTELRFGYLYNGHWKTYRPFANKKNKWFPNNVPITTLDGQDGIKCNTLMIQKSKKDFLVMNKVFPNNIAVQNEGIACFSPENIEYMRDVSDRQVLSFDNDVSGVKNSQQITKLLGFDYCNVPKEYLKEGITDWADLAKAYGLKVIEDYLKEKGIT